MQYKRASFLVLLLMALCLIQSSTYAAQHQILPGYVPFPKGYGYMQENGAILKAERQNNRKLVRKHAWRLWAGIMQPVAHIGWPIWYTWPNTTAAFASKQTENKITPSLLELNRANQPKSALLTGSKSKGMSVNTPAPIYDLPKSVIARYPRAVYKNSENQYVIYDGRHFQNNGDILIPTESLSIEAYRSIRSRKLYLKKTLNAAHKKGQHMIRQTDKFIVTKHMYWPVKAKGITLIPVWRNNFPVTYPGYAGYEYWNTLVALDPDGRVKPGTIIKGSFLYGVKDNHGIPIPPVTGKARVHSLKEFYYHKVTRNDWKSFNDADKAILDAASLWANHRPFRIGDYLVTIAMHVNTKEVASWTLQSVWWSDTPDKGIYATDRPKLPHAKGPWRHYLLTDAYNMHTPSTRLAVSFNPYIEGVIHPVATSCRNCHVRAGWPHNKAKYQLTDHGATCYDLLSKLTPSSDCFKQTTLADYLWIIPDRAN